MTYAQIGPISVHLPERVETNQELQEAFPRWDLKLIEEKTGIRQRHIAAAGETSSDLAVAASQQLFRENDIDPQSIDFVLFCTQTPDYPLPTTSCLIQDRLSLRTSCGAVDINLGCSGFIYGMAMADGLIQSGVAKRILFLTAETYTKYIAEDDRSLRTIFGDGAAATLITSAEEQSLWGFKFGSDGSGGDMLLVSEGGSRPPEDAIPPRNRKRWKSRLYMDGPGLINFTVDAVPKLVDEILKEQGLTDANISQYLMHQATWKMLDELTTSMGVDPNRVPIELSDVGNTVSCTIPILIDQLRKTDRIDPQSVNMLIGFGVGLSWAGCLWKDLAFA